ncbi:hypothetical protein OFR37_13770 [Brachyspira hyodysenteriae]|uniref:hypothetical protein n=1 Tax=Brachyspira hyodysenteriae TaxID=159 RepID=UPI0022CDAB03|nr:hypothetical protein [Brachyspira hyodysenteriae]MDA0036161.1 hypothetical protein [Brachyspira hyodysenteriae]MDA0055963.1 hypothetical protein [Brachyspira hyodysenteriae]
METITDNKSISIFGFNDFIKGAINIINKDFNIMAIYDNDINKSGIIYKNIKVYYFNSLNVEDIVLPILIFTTKESYFQISKQLSELNLLENKDFFIFRVYINILLEI